MDTGSPLNVLPKNSLSRLTIEGMMMKPSSLIVKAFDGSSRSLVGEIYIPVKIRPYTFFITFYVMDIYLTYSCILERPWIYSVGAVTSTLHQRLKFMINNKLVVVEGEEDIMVSHLESFRYIEVGGEIHETHFQAFEVVSMVMAPPVKESKKAELSMASWKDVKSVIKICHPEG